MIFHCDLPCIICDSSSIGPGPNDPNNPFVNLSSESPDADVFIGFLPRGGFPPLGSQWLTSFCLGWCVSDVSQEAADQCAAAAAVACLSTNWPTTGHGPDGEPVLEDRPIFYSFPQSGSFLCPDGSTFNFTTVAGLYTSVINQATADAEAYTWAVDKASINYVCLGSLSVTRACANVAFSSSIQVNSAHTPLTYVVTGALPPGITSAVDVSGTFLQLTGTPTAFGSYTFHLTVADNAGNTMAKDYTINIVGISTTSLPDAINGSAYSETVIYGGTPVGTLVWSVSAGILPIGMTLNSSTGEISGTCTVEATYGFTIKATDGTLSCSKTFTITVSSSCAIFGAIDWSAMIPFGTVVGSAVGNEIDYTATGPGIGLGTSGVDGVGTMLYTGPEITCSIDVLNIDGNGAAFLGIKQDGVLIFEWNSAVFGLGLFYFTLAAGVNSVIDFTGTAGSATIILSASDDTQQRVHIIIGT